MTDGRKLPDGWRLVRLGNVAEVLDARRVPLNSDERAKMPGKYPYYGANGIVDYIDQWIFDEVEDLILLAEDGGHFDEYRTRPIAYRVNGRCWVNNHAHVLKARDSGCGGFIFYSLAHKDVRPFIKGTTRSKLTQADLLQIEIGLPSDAREILAIAAVLDAIDDAIERTEAVIAATERLRDALLHELLTRGIPGWHSQWKEAPSIGTIPACWDVVRLGDAVTLQRGMDLPEERRIQGTIPIYGSNGIQAFHNSSPIEGPGVITGRSGSIGHVHYSESSYWPLNTTLYVRDFHGNYPRFVYHFLSTLGLKRFAASTGVPSLNRNFVHPVPVAVPPLVEQRVAAEALDGVDEAIERGRTQTDMLRSLKSSAADVLLTGRVRVELGG